MAYRDVVLADSPYLYWRLGETNFANPANDETANNRDGTYNGTSGESSVAGAISLDANTAVDFNGADSGGRVTWTPGAALTDTSYTVEFWFNADTTGFDTVFGCDNGSGGQIKGFEISINAGTTVYIQIPQASFASPPAVDTGSRTVSYVAGTWYHLAAVVDTAAKTWKIFLNGVQQGATGSWATVNAGFWASDRVLGLAHYGGSQHTPAFYYDGKVDEFAIYTTALSDSRILDHYMAGTAISGAAVLTGTSSLSAVGEVTPAASFSGTSSFSAEGEVIGVIKSGEGIFSGTGDFTADGTVTKFGEAALSGTSSFTASGTVTKFGAAALSGTSSFTVIGINYKTGAAALTGSGSLIASGNSTGRFGQAVLTGVGTLTASGNNTGRFGQAVLTGVGTLTVEGTFIEDPASVARQRREYIQYLRMMKKLLGG